MGQQSASISDTQGGAGTIYLKGATQEHGDLVIDNGGTETVRFSTPLRSVGPGVSTALEANVLTDDNASFPVPDPTTGSLGLVGLELNPNSGQGQTFTIIDNTATTIVTDPADGDMTGVATAADSYIGQYFWDNADIRGAAQVQTQDDCFATGTLEVRESAQLECNNLSIPAE